MQFYHISRHDDVVIVSYGIDILIGVKFGNFEVLILSLIHPKLWGKIKNNRLHLVDTFETISTTVIEIAR